MFDQIKSLLREVLIRMPKPVRRPVNIFITKIRNLERRFFSKKYFINPCNINLNSEPVQYTLKKPTILDSYRLSGMLYSQYNSNENKSCVIKFSFFDRDKNLINPEKLVVGLDVNGKFESIRRVHYTEGYTDFDVYFTPPIKTYNTIVNIKLEDGAQYTVQLVSEAYIQRIKKREQYISYILNKTFEFFEGRQKLSFDEIEKFINVHARQFEKEILKLSEIIYDQTKQKYTYLARYFGKMILKYNPSDWIAARVYLLFYRSGSISERNKVLAEFVNQGWISNDEFRTIRTQEEEVLLEKGFYMNPSPEPAYSPAKNVLYLLHNSLPYNSGGYAARTHGLIKNITVNSPFTVRGAARPGYPTDYKKHISKKLPKVIPTSSEFEGIEYLVGDQEIRRSKLSFYQYIQEFSNDIISKARQHNASIIHGASNYPNGFAAIQAARKLQIKSIYEVRGLWEITKMSRERFWKTTDQYHMTARLESQALQEADVGIVITKALKDLMVSRGVTKPLHIVPNAVDIEMFVPQEKNFELMKSLGIRDEVVIGYVGSVVEYEGLDDLLCACRNLKFKHNKKFKLVIVGDGAELNSLKEKTKVLDLKKEVMFTGRVPHSEVNKYISIIDIMPFPRKPYMVCEAVSPLKPFESLACKKAVLVSSCAALTEIIKHDETGLVFKKADLGDLTQKLIALIDSSELRNRIAENGYHWVRANRNWKAVSQIVSDLYAQLFDQISSEQRKQM
jgi:glycosyltransferase involved in cell wall biosynthesis